MSREKHSYKELRGEREYLKTLIATLISRFGDSIDSVAYSWMVYILTGSASLSAFTYGVNVLVSVVLQPFMASLITNFNKKLIMVTADIGRSVLVSATAFLFWAELLEPWMIVFGTALMSAFEAFRQPASTSVFPKVVPKEKYTTAMSLNSMASRIAELAGLGAAGLVIKVLGIQGALFIDAATFVISAAILITLRLPKHIKIKVENQFKEFVKNTKEGFAYVVKHRLILCFCLLACLLNAIFVPLSALTSPFIKEGLKLGESALSLFSISLTVGMIIGAFVFPFLASRIKRYKLLFFCLFLISLMFVFLSTVAFVPEETARWILFPLVLLILGICTAMTNTLV